MTVNVTKKPTSNKKMADEVENLTIIDDAIETGLQQIVDKMEKGAVTSNELIQGAVEAKDLGLVYDDPLKNLDEIKKKMVDETEDVVTDLSPGSSLGAKEPNPVLGEPGEITPEAYDEIVGNPHEVKGDMPGFVTALGDVAKAADKANTSLMWKTADAEVSVMKGHTQEIVKQEKVELPMGDDEVDQDMDAEVEFGLQAVVPTGEYENIRVSVGLKCKCAADTDVIEETFGHLKDWVDAKITKIVAEIQNG